MSASQHPGDGRVPGDAAREPAAVADPPTWLILIALAAVLATAVALVAVTGDVTVLAALGALVVVTVGALYRRRH